MRLRVAALPLVLAAPLPFATLACSSDAHPPAAAELTPADDAGADGAPADAGDAADALDADGGPTIPDGPAGDQLAWVLGALNGGAVSDADVAAHFTAAFVAKVPAAQLEATFSDLAQHAPWALAGFEGPVGSSALVAEVTRDDGEWWRLSLVTSASEAGKIAGLQLAPAGDLDPSLASFDAIDTALAELAPKANWLAASVDDAGCSEIHALNPSSSLAVASAFKLWILATLADQIGADQKAWTDTLAIQDEHKSLPSGEMQNQPVGATFTLQQFAGEMISISDNTAADHLLFAVGRDAVESMLATAAHHDPSLDQPFLATRELFTLKLLLSPADQQAFIAADVPQKRALLDQYDATLDPRTYAGPPWTAPKLIDQLEWFATPMDLCNVMRALEGYGERPATHAVYDVLSINPGIADATGAFAYVGFKGGSEPGVLDLTWLLRRASDQAWRVVTIGLNDTTKPLDEERAVYVAGAARALVAN